MKIEIMPDYDTVSHAAAGFVARQVLLRPESVLALPTGRTPRLMYEILVALYQKGLINLAEATVFNLDEFIGLPKTHNMSYCFYLEERFVRPTNLNRLNVHLFDGMATSIAKECLLRELAMQRSGGIDLAILGIGRNGHIGFNEPGSAWDSKTRPLDLSDSTLLQNKSAQRDAPLIKRAITMGIRSIMNSRRILLVASGAEKMRIMKAAVDGPITKEVPASILQLHPDLTVIVDRPAAAMLAANDKVHAQKAHSEGSTVRKSAL